MNVRVTQGHRERDGRGRKRERWKRETERNGERERWKRETQRKG